MNKPVIHQEIEIDAPADQVWPFVATEAGLRRWWGNEISLEPVEGGRCTERITLNGAAMTQQGRVTHYDPPRRLTLTFLPDLHGETAGAAATPGALRARISITLDEADGKTRVMVEHQVLDHQVLDLAAGLPTFPMVIPAPTGPQMGLGEHRSTSGFPWPSPAVGRVGDAHISAHCFAAQWERRLQGLAVQLHAARLPAGIAAHLLR